MVCPAVSIISSRKKYRRFLPNQHLPYTARKCVYSRKYRDIRSAFAILIRTVSRVTKIERGKNTVAHKRRVRRTISCPCCPDLTAYRRRSRSCCMCVCMFRADLSRKFATPFPRGGALSRDQSNVSLFSLFAARRDRDRTRFISEGERTWHVLSLGTVRRFILAVYISRVNETRDRKPEAR